MKSQASGLLLLLGVILLAGQFAGADKAKKDREDRRPKKLIAQRLDDSSDEDLRKELLTVPEVGLDPLSKSSNSVITMAAQAIASGEDHVLVGDNGERLSLKELVQSDLALNLAPRLMLQRRDLAGLRIRLGLACRLGKESAENLQALSRKLRTHLEASIPARSLNDPRPDASVLRTRLLGDKEQSEWLDADAVPALQQLLMAENKPVRLLLVHLLSKIEGKRASVALVQRVLFDLHPRVRESAIKALQDRPKKHYAVWLTEALRYPWPAVVSHAAEAMVALKIKGATSTLVSMLREADPDVPFEIKLGKKKVTVVRELVRVNHLSNCLLCHAQSLVSTDLVRGAVPRVGRALPAPVTTPAYYEGKNGAFVRADITYLKQDFSVFQPVANPRKWPEYQRYDYLVRLRILSRSELTQFAKLKGKVKSSRLSAQKQSIMYALRGLTGKNLGSTVEAWEGLISKSEVKTGQGEKLRIEAEEVFKGMDPAAARLCVDLVKAPADKQNRLIQQYQDSKGAAYTEALAACAPRLSKPRQETCRKALVARLARMNAATLSAKLEDDSAEVRRAAALACARKNSKKHLPEIIALLGDDHPAVAAAAHAALKEMSGQDFGPKAGASKAEYAAATAKWKRWWKEEGKK